MRPDGRERGAALLLAMLTAALVATFAAHALWQQWRSVEVEGAERSRLQAAWILLGALDWARVILAEDARSSRRIDHLAEPWAVPLEEARLSTFLAAQGGVLQRGALGDGQLELTEAFLSGQITDLQAKLNVRNLLSPGERGQAAARAFARLCERLGLPEGQAAQFTQALRQAAQKEEAGQALMPRTLAQLTWLGLPPQALTVLQEHVTVLPAATPVNLNTASAEVIWAAVPELSWPQARQLVQWRSSHPLQNLRDAAQALDVPPNAFSPTRHAVFSQYFEVQGRMRLGDLMVRERSVLMRQGMRVHVLWRERDSGEDD